MLAKRYSGSALVSDCPIVDPLSWMPCLDQADSSWIYRPPFLGHCGARDYPPRSIGSAFREPVSTLSGLAYVVLGLGVKESGEAAEGSRISVDKQMYVLSPAMICTMTQGPRARAKRTLSGTAVVLGLRHHGHHLSVAATGDSTFFAHRVATGQS